MAATDGQITVAAARWAAEGNYLREFVAKHRLPAVVKIIKGQYGGLGVPTLPSPGLQSTALLVSLGQRQKIEAQAVKIKEGRRLACVGPRLAIPDSYRGYFELLSEEGRAVKCIESVAELARRRPEEGFLVREPLRALHAKTDLDAGGACRTVPAGDILVPCGEAALPGAKGRYLRCTNAEGELLLLGMEQRGKFSALAREDNISGVHTARTLLSKRMPLSVRLVHGTTPRGLKAPSHFVPELRLLSIFEEEHVFALPLQKDAQSLTALPLAAPLKVVRTKNDEQLRQMPEFERLVERCARLVTEVADRIQVLDGKLGDPKRPHHHHYQVQQQLQPQQPSQQQPPPPASAPDSAKFALRRSASSDSANYRARADHKRDENRIPVHPKDYEEIDQIYDYVRGFAPLPKSVRSPFADPPQQTQHAPHTHSVPASLDLKPEPPPIETIPTKKGAEKRNRKGTTSSIRDPSKVHQLTQQAHERTPPGLPKLYVKNSQSQRRLFRQKSASPMKETPPSPISKSGSPIFNIRYKSLSNLQQAMELDGTLDSSNSGGRASGDSGPGMKQPEKRSRKLSRPRSLTNLVWELREYPDISMAEKPKHPPQALVYKKHAKHPHKRAGALYL